MDLAMNRCKEAVQFLFANTVLKEKKKICKEKEKKKKKTEGKNGEQET